VSSFLALAGLAVCRGARERCQTSVISSPLPIVGYPQVVLEFLRIQGFRLRNTLILNGERARPPTNGAAVPTNGAGPPTNGAATPHQWGGPPTPLRLVVGGG